MADGPSTHHSQRSIVQPMRHASNELRLALEGAVSLLRPNVAKEDVLDFVSHIADGFVPEEMAAKAEVAAEPAAEPATAAFSERPAFADEAVEDEETYGHRRR
jgi:hypothetical protein